MTNLGSRYVLLSFCDRKSASFAVEQNQEGYVDLGRSIERSHTEMVNLRNDLGALSSVTQNNSSILDRLSGLVTGYCSDRVSSLCLTDQLHRDLIPQLRTLVDLASKVWWSNIQIMSFFAHMKTSTLSPELRYTWFQEPIRFEDAMGRVIPIPSEYNWEASSSLSCPILVPS